ncbi:MAG: PAS domain S-box protein [Luteolibacter sp.]
MKRKPTIIGAADAELTLHKLQAQQIVLETRNTELQEAKQRLESLLEKYTDLYDFTPVSYFSLDKNSVILEVNSTGAALLGADRSELIQAPFYRFVTPAGQPDFRDFLKRAFAGNGEEGCDLALVKQDGATFWARFRGTAAISAQGGEPWCRVSVANLTVFRQSEAALRESQMHVRLATEATGVGIWEWNVLTGTILWDSQMFHIYGVAPTPSGIVQYTDWSTAVMPEEFSETERILHDTVRRCGQSRREFRIRRRDDGEVRDIESVETVRTNDQGEAEWVIGTNLDVTERKQAETKERENQEQFQTLAEAMPQLAWMAQPDGFITWYNQRWFDYTGTTPQQMEGWGWQTVHDPEALPKVLERWKASIATAQPFEMVFPLRRADGVFRSFLTRVVPLKDARGRVLQWFGTNTDVHDLKQAEETSARLAAIVQSSDHAIIGKDLNGIITSWNHGAERLFGYTEKEAIGQSITMLIPDDLPEEEAGILHTLRRGNPINHYETKRRRKDGTIVEVSLTVSPIRNASGEIVGASKIARDITERKRMEQELLTSSAELKITNEQLAAMSAQIQAKNDELERRVAERTARLQALAGELTQAEERERRRIAQLLHDELQQLLIAAKIHLEIVCKLGAPQSSVEVLQRLAELINESNDVARSLSHELSPVALQQGDLPRALKWLAGWMEQNHGLTVRILADSTAGPVEGHVKVWLYQSVRELLVNVVKHAGIKRAQVRLSGTPAGQLEILVSDRGKGFDPTCIWTRLETSSGFGLFSIRERLHLMGGRMSVESSPNCGSRFRLVVPLQKATQPLSKTPESSQSGH